MKKRKSELQNKILKKYQEKVGEPFSDRVDMHLLGVVDPRREGDI